MVKGKIIIISGPSGSGKTTLYQRLLSSHKNIVKSISVTTRQKRPGEVHGKDYFFVSLKMFEYKIRSDHFLEFEKFFDNYYGTPKKYVFDLISRGKNVLLCIDVKGASTVIANEPNAVRIFIRTPSIKDLESRLLKRGSEDKQTIQNRLKRVKLELKEAKQYDYEIVNDDLLNAQKQLFEIVERITSQPDM